jgi:hypothetical protein
MIVQHRSVATALISLLLMYPAAGSVPLARWNIHLWQRLRSHKEPPQASFDRYLRAVGAYVPANGTIGLVLAGSPRLDDAVRIRYLLQYALAPRQIVPSPDCAFVIVYGPVSGDAPFADAAAFQLIKVVGDDLRVFRRVPR